MKAAAGCENALEAGEDSGWTTKEWPQERGGRLGWPAGAQVEVMTELTEHGR